MKIDIQLTPEQISKVVSRELMRLYEDMRSDGEGLLPMYSEENEEALKYVRHLVEFYTEPTEFNKWWNAE
jgi:hypothetical protein